MPWARRAAMGSYTGVAVAAGDGVGAVVGLGVGVGVAVGDGLGMLTGTWAIAVAAAVVACPAGLLPVGETAPTERAHGRTSAGRPGRGGRQPEIRAHQLGGTTEALGVRSP